MSAETYLDSLTRLLNALVARPTAITAQPLDGVGRRTVTVHPPFASVPFQIVQLLDDDFSLTVPVASCDVAGVPQALHMVISRWRPETAFGSLDGDRKGHHVTQAGYAAVETALATMPPPSVRVDAGPDQWAGWTLATPMLDLSAAQTLLDAIAARVGGEPITLTTAVPLAGWVRNFGNQHRTSIHVVEADASRVYDSSVLLPPESHEHL